MAQRTIYTCDRCHKDWEGKENNPFGVNWSWGDKLGIRTFILCGECTAALKAFLSLDPPRQTAECSVCHTMYEEERDIRSVILVCKNCRTQVDP